MPALHSTGDRRDVRDGPAGLIVDKQRQFAQFGGGLDELVPLLLVEVAGPQVVPVDLRAKTQKAFRQFEVRLLEAEDEDTPLRFVGHRLGDVAHQCGLPHAGTRSQDNQLRSLKPIGLGIEVDKTGAQPADGPFDFQALVDTVPGVDQDVANLEFLGGFLLFQDAEDSLLGRLQDLVRVPRRIITLAKNLGARVNQAALNPLVADDLGVVSGVCRVRDRLTDFRQVGNAADLFDLVSPLDLVG